MQSHFSDYTTLAMWHNYFHMSTSLDSCTSSLSIHQRSLTNLCFAKKISQMLYKNSQSLNLVTDTHLTII
jgi:hypothetical protein